MEELYSVKLSKIIDEFKLEALYLPDLPENISVSCSRVNRPGLQMIGFYDHYEQARIQIIGKVENLFIADMDPAERRMRLEDFFRTCPTGVIITTSMEPISEFYEFSEKYGVPLLRTSTRTSEFMAALIAYLNVALGPRITRHGVLVEVYGEGILLIGDSGVGKSETAIELLKRGHRLIADDAVEIKKVSATTLVGRAPEIIRHYVEYQREVVLRRTKFDYNKAKERAHVLEGLIVAIRNIDEVIKIIKTAANTTEARQTLRTRFELSEVQAQAILDLRLARLTKLEVFKLEEELKQLKELMAKTKRQNISDFRK